MSADQPDDRQEYLHERRLLIDWEQSASTSFDKAMLTISSGALALSLTYLKQLGSGPPWHWTLKACWVMFGASLLSTSWSFLFSQHAMRRQRGILPLDKQGPRPGAGKGAVANYWGCATNCLNWMSVVFLTLGVVSLAAYAISGGIGKVQP